MPNYLLEVGTEELPADFVSQAIQQWKNRIHQDLTAEFLAPATIEFYGTPRRLAVLIKGIPPKQPDRVEEIKGPPKKAAFQAGQPTQAAEGFARKQGVKITDFEIRDTPKGEFIFIRKAIPGRLATEILTELSPQWITGLEGKRFMVWGDGDLRFARPIRWLVALVDQDILPFKLINGSEIISTERVSRGHRVLHPQPVVIEQATDYALALRSAYVEVDPAVRKQTIIDGIETKAQQVAGKAEIYPNLLAEVINLVEYPNAVLGKFDSEFLALPREVITTVMVTHQRYFPVTEVDSPTQLLPYFITISNGDPAKAEIIAEGNARVIRARLADAKFFYETDCKTKLEDYLPKLEKVTFQAELGSIKDKVDRMLLITKSINQQLKLSPQQAQETERTTYLAKADLVTQMVYEFPELQGIMGEKYALVSGETPSVARGIFEHYLPRTADDVMPETINGQVVALSDRLDTLVSIFGLEMMPTGSSDPFGLRRAANSVIKIIWHGNLAINLAQLIAEAAANFVQQHPERQSPENNLREFFIQRLRTLLQEELKINYDLVNAVLGEQDEEYKERALKNLLDLRDRAQFLQKIRQNGQLNQIYETVNRSTRLAAKGNLDTQTLDPTSVVNPNLFEKSSEQAFYEALVKLLPQTQKAQKERNYQLLIEGLKEITPIVSKFFDGEESVLVMADDPAIRANRLNLLALLRNHSRVLADFSAIVV